jgi:hypothetical protein
MGAWTAYAAELQARALLEGLANVAWITGHAEAERASTPQCRALRLERGLVEELEASLAGMKAVAPNDVSAAEERKVAEQRTLSDRLFRESGCRGRSRKLSQETRLDSRTAETTPRRSSRTNGTHGGHEDRAQEGCRTKDTARLRSPNASGTEATPLPNAWQLVSLPRLDQCVTDLPEVRQHHRFQRGLCQSRDRGAERCSRLRRGDRAPAQIPSYRCSG